MAAEGPFDEFRRLGTLGPQGIELLYDTVAAVARFDRYPTPSGAYTWGDDDVQDVAHDVLTGPRGIQRITGLFVKADDDRSLERLLETTVRNHFRSQARGTDRGHLLLRLRDVLENDGRFERVAEGTPGAGRWRRAGSGDPPWGGSVDDLVDAAWTVESLEMVRWRADASKRSPVAHREALVRLMETVLDEAEGSLEEAALAEVVSRRFGLALGPTFASLDEPLEPDRPSLEPVDPAAEVGPDRVAAEMLWSQLGEEEQAHLVAVARGGTVREVAELAGIGKSSVTPVSERLGAKIWELMGNVPDEAVVGYLMDLARDGSTRTEDGDPASDRDEGDGRGTP